MKIHSFDILYITDKYDVIEAKFILLSNTIVVGTEDVK